MAAPNHADAMHLARKKAFYASLNSMLDSDEDKEEDPGRKKSMAAMHQLKSEAAAKRDSSALARSNSDTNLARKHQNQDHPAVENAAPRPTTSHGARTPMLKKAETFAGQTTKLAVPSSSGAAPAAPPVKVTGKRKRDALKVPLVPEERRVFKGSTFYFFPNLDTNPARRTRITKAQEYGVTRATTESEVVTHIIVDRDMPFSEVEKHTKMSKLSPNVVVVNELWPADCIMWNRLVDPALQQYAVKGYTPPSNSATNIVKDSLPQSSATSEESLKLKAAGKAVHARLPETPNTDNTGSSSPALALTSRVPSSFNDGPDSPSASKVLSTTEFDAIIQQAKDLPVDDDDEEVGGDDSRPTSSSAASVSDTPSGSDTASKKKTRQEQRQEKFQCMHAHTGEKSGNPNARTIEVLQELATHYDEMKDQWRTRAYRQAVTALKRSNDFIQTKEQALRLLNIGKQTAEKIEEIAATGRLRRLDNVNADPTDQIFRAFTKVYGVGPTAAHRFIDQGFKTLDDLANKAELTEAQRIGLEHYLDFNTRIPRAEVKQHGDIVRAALQQIDKDFDVVIGGSYRRGAQDSGDIDCLVTHPTHTQTTIRNIVLNQLVPRLMKARFFVAALAETSRDDGSKWHGASCIPTVDGVTIWRRIDLLLVPAHEFGAALIYFTGNDIFNRSMRLLASTKQMRLNQRGLFIGVLRGKGRVKLTDGELVEGRDEKKIFEILGVPWRPPQHRIP